MPPQTLPARILLHFFLFPFSFFLSSGAVSAQRNAIIPDSDPEIERKSFIVADGFEVNLYAADPLLAKPIQMNFDPQGRLWVASSEIYPQIKPGQVANDKVLVLEDTNGDGKADKTTVFADGLLIPTGLAPGDGGVYVADSTDLVHFSHPDPKTGKAQKKRIVLSGFGTEDTHHIIHTFRWGPDCALYFSQSIYIHSHIETPHGVRRLNAGGIWQFRPETDRLEVFARGWVNSWGTRFDKWGATFATDGAGGEGINYVVPGAYYATAAGASRILNGLNPGSPKDCGLEVLSGRHLPDDWQGNLVTNDFRGHRVCRYVLKADGSGYSSQEQPELIKTTHAAFRPIDVAMGPDSAIYVADWYNPIIQHGEVDFRDERRDHTHGRIWRITAKNRPLVERPKLVGATVPELLEQLKSPEEWTRLQAKRVLKERGAKDVLPELGVWVSRLDPNAANYEHLRLEALWAYQSLDVPEPKLLASVLESKEPGARATASRIAGEWASRLSNPVAVLAPRVLDENPRVRLEAVRALVQLNTPTAAVVASQALDKPLDKWLDYAIWLTLRELAPVWLPELQAGKIDFGGDPKKIVFALQAAGSGDVVKPLLGLWTSGKIGRDRAAAVLPMVAQLGGPVELQTAWTEAGKLAAEQPGTATAILAGLEQSARQRNAKPTNSRNSVANLIASTNADVRLAAVKLAGAWKEDAARVELVKLVEATDTAVSLRQAAADSLASIGTLDAVKALAALGAADRPVAVRLAAVSALASADTGTAAKLAVELLGDSPISADPSTLFTAFAQRKTGAAELARALKGKKLPGDVAKIGVRVAKAAGQPDQTLIDALTTAGSLTTPKRDFTKAEIDALTANVLKLGDAARGEKIYRRADANCMKCHAIAGAGGVVGPDFTSIGASAQPDYLVESLLLPNAKIKEGYNSYIVATVDGKVVTGTKVREANGQLVLRDAEDREIVIPLADIESRKDGKSLMPDGTTDSLTGQEFLDLAKFLSVLGKVDSGYAAAAGRVVRRWETVQLTKELFTLTNRDRIAAVARPGAAISWVPAYSLVSGDLPLTELPQFQPHKTQPPYSVARFQLDVTTAGKVKLLLNDPVGLSLWVDGVPLDAAKEMTPTLKAGVRTVTVAVNSELRQSPLRVELDEVSGSPARARIIGGK